MNLVNQEANANSSVHSESPQVSSLSSSKSSKDSTDPKCCDICGKSFYTKSNAKRHKKTVHEWDEWEPPKKPVKVQMVLSSSSISSEESKGFKCCDICGMSFYSTHNVILHKKSEHGWNCENPSNVEQRKMKRRRFEKKYKCRICENKFSTTKSRRRHEKSLHHGFTPDFKRKLICSECNINFNLRKDIMDHFSDAHPNIKIITQEKEFKSVDDFNSWKSKVEKQTLSVYICTQNFKTKDILNKKFRCHRTGQFESKSTGQRRYQSNKIAYFCPASIKARILDDGRVYVTFISTHMGHDCDITNLRKTKYMKEKFAEVLAPINEENDSSLGNDFEPENDSSLDNDFTLEIDSTGATTEQLVSTKLQMMRKVALSYGVNMDYFRSIDGALPVDSWAKEMKSKGCSPILIYKFTDNALDECSNVDVDDFILGFMDKAEKDIFLWKNGSVNKYSTHSNKKG